MRIVADVVVRDDRLPPPVAARGFATRKLYVRKVEIEKFGAPPGCPGCINIALAGDKSIAHSAVCRARIEEAMLAADDGLMAERVEAAKKRKEVPLGIADAEASDPEPKRVRGAPRDEDMPEQRGQDELMMALAALGDAGHHSASSAFDLKSGLAVDLRVGWDLSDEVQLENAWEILRETKPGLVVMTPMRMDAASLLDIVKGSAEYEEKMRKGMEHLKKCTEFAQAQIEEGGFFLFEQPWSAWSWSAPEAREIVERPEVQVVEGHLCAYEPDVPELAERVTVWSDAKFAGHRRTRRLTSGGVVLFGKHCIKPYSQTQETVALSSPESEFYGIAKATTMGPGAKGLMTDLGLETKVQINTDSSAARSSASRIRAGRVRRIEVRELWVQDRVAKGELEIKKVKGEENVADGLTKHVGRQKMEQYKEASGVPRRSGRHELSPQFGDSV